ncbi:MAG TPA: alpha-hydroxy acid oxidase [Burkholderiales bacterium]|nr:alpha-hydroxy acid oxidase [Burkholderiales bacterium]
MNAAEALNIDDLRAAARRILPRVAYEFLERGAEDEVSVDDNRAAFERIRFRPRTLVDVSQRSQEVTLFGKTYAMPVGIAPTGAAGLYWHEADLALARAAAAAGVPFVLSTASFVAMERVAAEAGGAKWFQLYANKDRLAVDALIARARDAGYEALVVTSDVCVGGNREYNLRNGFDVPFRLNMANLAQGVLHPRWLLNVFFRTLMKDGVPRFRNVDTDVGGRIVARNLQEFRSRRDALDWEDFEWMRRAWPRKLFVKGVLTVADARRALAAGADGVFVSNHGGRQLDGALAPLDALPDIADAVGHKLAVVLDGGLRRGSDVVKALALGARMVFTGRATLYGASVAGEAGVARALQIFRSEVDRVMALLGVSRLEELGRDHLVLPRR